MFLHEPNLVFYHPLDSFTDGASPPVVWTSPDPGGYFPTAMTFANPGKIGDSVTASDGAMASASYPGAPGVTRLTAAFWMKTAGGTDMFVGHEGGGPGAFNSLQALQLFASGAVTFFHGDGQTSGIPAAVSVIADADFHLYVLDLVREAPNWRLRWSRDGGAFTVKAAFSAPAMVNSPSSGLIGTRGNNVDEMVLWRNLADPFTSEELANLYDLADTFGAPMDQYQEFFGAPICWQATARMPDGSMWRDSGPGPCPPVVRVPRGASDIVVADDGSPASPRIVEG